MPPTELPDPHAAFAALDTALPLALLPVRLETRFFLAHDPPELRVRIIPDAIHADGHRDGLLPSEAAAGRAFWRRIRSSDAAGRDAAFAWLSARLGPWRAAWVATATKPGADPEAFAPGPTRARLLPVRFAAVLYASETMFGPWWGAPVVDDPALAPGPVDVEGEVDGRAWLDAQGLAWTHDFAAAEADGLAIRIDLSAFSPQQRRDGFDELAVLGVRPGDASEPVRDLLWAQRYTNGLDLIPQGTPTNTTETSGPGLSLDAPDLAVLRAAELDARPPVPRPRLRADGDLFRAPAADAVSLALGLGGPNALDRAAHAGLAEGAGALAMNQALWPALGGHYADHVLDGVLSGAERRWLRDWSVHFARGGAPLPTLLVGSQPYGLLPVSLLDRTNDGASAEIDRVERVLAAAREEWNFAGVPSLDPDAADVPQDDELVAAVSQVMAAVPHPTGWRLQPVDAMRDFYLDAWNVRLFLLGLACGLYPLSDGEPSPDYHDSQLWPLLEELQAGLEDATGPTGQVLAIQAFQNALWPSGGTDTQQTYRETWEAFTQTGLRDLVNEHASRVSLALGVLPASTGVTGKLGKEDEPNAFFTLHPEGTARSWALPLVGEDPAAWLAELAGAPLGTAADHAVPRPLLHALLVRAAEQATEPGDQAAVRAGLTGLQTVADAPGELERLLRETLGVAGYRLDAWFTAVAAWRLERRRRTTPAGIQVGAYGFVERVRPRAPGGPSQGYVLAPSLPHATTAAILRSGWAAFCSEGQSGALAVDLSSDRMRRARWLVDGVREGQDLARLLGARFERGLRDAEPELDHRADEFRSLALEAVGDPSPPMAIVDGLLLARARLDPEDLSDAEQAAQTAIDALLDNAGGERAGLETVLDSLAADLDAVGDAAVAQSVFALAQGNVPEAAATLTAAGSGDASFPDLRVLDTPRPAVAVTHRLLALLGPAAKGAATGGRALAAPALDAWVAGLLGKPSDWRFTVRFVQPDTGEASDALRATLADVGLAALDVVFLAPVGEQPGLGRLDAVLAAWGEGRRPAGVPARAVAVVEPGRGDGSLADLAVVARALRRLVSEARDLDGRDLAAPGATDVPAGVDLVELEARVARVRDALVARREALAAALPAAPGEPARGDLRATMLAFGGFELPGWVPAPADGHAAPDALHAQGDALLAAVDARLAALDARLADEAPGWASLDDVAQAVALTARLHLLVGHALPVAPRFTPADPEALDATFARRRLAGRGAATAWLAAAGRVDPGARRLRVAIDLTEAARDATLFDFGLGQLPDREEEGWAALERPRGDERGRLCLLATGTPQPTFAGHVAGLVLSTWTEALPRRGHDAGLAVHFDAPSARAPQSILLCTAKGQDGFAFDAVRRMSKQTFDLARVRMVGPETLERFGQFLPAAYLHEDTTPV